MINLFKCNFFWVLIKSIIRFVFKIKLFFSLVFIVACIAFILHTFMFWICFLIIVYTSTNSIKFLVIWGWLSICVSTVFFLNISMYRKFYQEFKKILLSSVLIFLSHSNFFVLCEQKKEEFLLILETEVLLVEVIPRTQVTVILINPSLDSVAVNAEELGVNALNFDQVIANADADRAVGLASRVLNTIGKKNKDVDVDVENISHDYTIYMMRDGFDPGLVRQAGIRTFRRQADAFERLRTPDSLNEEGVRFTRVGLRHFFELMEHLRRVFIRNAEPVRENFISYFERYFWDIVASKAQN